MVSWSWNYHPRMGGDGILRYIHTAAVVMTGAEWARVCFLWELNLTPICSSSIGHAAADLYCCFPHSPTCRWPASLSWICPFSCLGPDGDTAEVHVKQRKQEDGPIKAQSAQSRLFDKRRPEGNTREDRVRRVKRVGLRKQDQGVVFRFESPACSWGDYIPSHPSLHPNSSLPLL